MFGVSDITALLIAGSGFLAAVTAFLRTIVPVNAKLNRLLDIVSHEWETNGKTGVRDTITLMLEKLDAIEARLARGDQRFDDIEAGQREAAERGEAILAEQSRVREKLESHK